MGDAGKERCSEDGMTKSIMSHDDAQEYLMDIKGRKLSEEQEWVGRASLSIIKIVQNIDELSEPALNVKLTKNDFIDCLRQVTREKMTAIKEAK